MADTRNLIDSLSVATTTDHGVVKLAAHAGVVAGTAVQADDARLTAAADLAAHLADASAAHAASAIAYDHTTSGLAATDAQGALDELAGATMFDLPAAIHAATGKTTPVDADELPLVDSAASFVLKKVTWANVKATAKTYFDTLYAAIAHTHAASDIASGTIAQARLGSGSGGAGTKVLYDDQTYKTPTAGYSDPLTTRGDLAYRDASITTRKALGSAGQRLESDGTDLVYADDYYILAFVIDGGGVAITTGVKGDIEIPMAGTIQRVTLLPDQSGSIVLDLWVDTYANYPPTVADTIVASAKPTLSSATKSQDSTLTGWTTAVAAGSTLRYNVDSITTVTRVLCSLLVRKS